MEIEYNKIKSLIQSQDLFIHKLGKRVIIDETRYPHRKHWRARDHFYFDPYPHIVINVYFQNKCLVAVLIHELGHCLSWALNLRPCSLTPVLEKHNTGKRLILDERKILLQEEELAWKLGAQFVKVHGFTLNKSFYRKKYACLQSYRKLLCPK